MNQKEDFELFLKEMIGATEDDNLAKDRKSIFKLATKLKYQFEKIVSHKWQHEDTGYICVLPFWRKPNKRWYRIHRLKEIK